VKNGHHRRVLSLFTGAGGLDLGLEAAGFRTSICVEIDRDARATLQANRPRWTLANPSDVYSLAPQDLLKQADLRVGDVELLAGGPPCQPFSKSGYWAHGDSKRLDDPRSSTLRAYLRIVECALPRVVLLENVKGLAFHGKDEGLKLLQAGFDGINRRHKTKYHLNLLHADAADYGVPQFRERVIIIASVDGREFRLPARTHGLGPDLEPFRTAWDAIGDLDSDEWPAQLNAQGKWARLLPSVPEGENYLWHTSRSGGEPLFGWRTRFWSFLLKLAKVRPSWTIQAEPGPATGPFHWKSRMLSSLELARLQTFPRDYEFRGDRRSVQRQIGNAVPSALAEMLGLEIRRQLLDEPQLGRVLTLLPARAGHCPPRERLRRVPDQYLERRGRHLDHPGPGLGPGARRREATERFTLSEAAA
jgi:DNA (cytosine-5)-methyltransferase 1